MGGISIPSYSGDICTPYNAKFEMLGVTLATFTQNGLDCPIKKGPIMISSHAESLEVLPDWLPLKPVKTTFKMKTSAGKEMLCLASTSTPASFGGLMGNGNAPTVVVLAGVVGVFVGVVIGAVVCKPFSASQQKISQPPLLA